MQAEGMTLRKRNEIFDTVRGRCALYPEDFKFEYDLMRAEILHVPTESTFMLSEFQGSYSLHWKVTDGPASEFGGDCPEWNDVLDVLTDWCDEVKYVASTPDFWQELQASRDAITAVVTVATDNSVFLPSELDAIHNSFDAVKPLIRERYDLPGDQLAAVEQKLDELVEASRTMGRKDWLTLVASTGFTLIVGSMIPPSVVQQALGLALRGIAHLFGVDLPPLPITT